MNLVGYIRVSTAGQVEDGYGLDVQLEAVERWCASNGHNLLVVHRDEGVSGAKDEGERAGLAAALVAVEDVAEGLVVPKLDRLARALTVQEAALAQVWKSGGRVFSVDIGEIHRDDPDDPMRTAMRQMVGVFAQLERGMIAMRLRGGRRKKASAGGYAYGAPRFGQEAVEKSLVPLAAEQETIARIVELRREDRSFRYIANTLNIEGRRPKRAERWHPETVARVVRRLHDDAGSAAA